MDRNENRAHEPRIKKPPWEAPTILMAGSLKEIVQTGGAGKAVSGPDADGLRG